MPFDARVLRVLIASPSDTAEARDYVETVVHRWNVENAHRTNVVYLPSRWESGAVARLGDDGQALINKQLVRQADVVVALFHSKLGAATPRAVSGTAEEIELGMDMGVPVHVYFDRGALPNDVDIHQLAALRDFEKTLFSIGLIGSFTQLEELGHSLNRALNADADEVGATEPAREVAIDAPSNAPSNASSDRPKLGYSLRPSVRVHPYVGLIEAGVPRNRRVVVKVENSGSSTATYTTALLRYYSQNGKLTTIAPEETYLDVPAEDYVEFKFWAPITGQTNGYVYLSTRVGDSIVTSDREVMLHA